MAASEGSTAIAARGRRAMVGAAHGHALRSNNRCSPSHRRRATAPQTPWRCCAACCARPHSTRWTALLASSRWSRSA
eukprot:1867854-Prymnesium_polylepis.1